jgi:hypothetical protein
MAWQWKSWWTGSASRVIASLLSDKQSIATGLMIALIVWTVTRLVDGITNSGTIEYDTVYTDTTLANGQPAKRIEVTLTNLSSDTAVSKLRVAISDPYRKTIFSTERGDSSCAFEPPAWANDAICDSHDIGMTFEAPMLVPGTSARIAMKYTQSNDATQRPIVRIRPEATGKFQLVEPGVRTFVARYEAAVLLSLLCFTFVLFIISLAAGMPKPSP